MKRIVSFLFFLLLSSTLIKGQSNGVEVLFPLSSNSVIKDYLKKNPASPALMRTTSSSDTIPFVDDFSKPGSIYPDAAHWLDSGAFINSTFCDNPITVGVATLDGIDKYGNPYDLNCGTCQSIICDYLTSRPIDLRGLTAGDNVYFSFYYQPTGLGDEPETGDSLVLQFFGKDTVWKSIWNHDGSPDTAFKRVNINITDSNYLDSTFQFRFLNYATPNGNRDHWNIDYVFLDKNRSAIDSLVGPHDIAFINRPGSLLKDYESMPWSHYKNYPSQAALMKTSFADSIRNIWYSNTTIRYHANINDSTGYTSIYNFPSQTPPTLNQNTVAKLTSNMPGSFVFPANANASSEFIIKNYIDSIGYLRQDNDTTYYTQKFDNYYAYDDGSAEAAYGLSVAYSKMAYRFDLKMADTLRGIQIYFNPWGKDVSSELIQICLWDSINVGANYEHLVHKQINRYVTNIDSINGFATYVFDTSQFVTGRIYVGIIQNSANLLGIGVDANTNTSDKMFINYNNHWYQSGIPASWMIRPFFGKNILAGIDEQSGSINDFEIYPNPTGDRFTVNSSQYTIGSALDIYNVLGETVYHTKFTTHNPQTTIDVSGLPDGIYFVKLSDAKNGTGPVKRLIIQH